jgi:hypothetical protein
VAVYDAYDGSQLQADTERAVELGAVAIGQAVEVALVTAVEVASLPPQVLQADDAEGEQSQLSAEANQEQAAEAGVVEATACPMMICQYFPDPIPENWWAPPCPPCTSHRFSSTTISSAHDGHASTLAGGSFSAYTTRYARRRARESTPRRGLTDLHMIWTIVNTPPRLRRVSCPAERLAPLGRRAPPRRTACLAAPCRGS